MKVKVDKLSNNKRCLYEYEIASSSVTDYILPMNPSEVTGHSINQFLTFVFDEFPIFLSNLARTHSLPIGFLVPRPCS